MEYRQIVAVTGLGGLYQLVSTKNDGAIVRNLADKSVKFISARVHQITPLESIEIYTYSDNVRLQEVLKNMKDHEAELTQLNIGKADSKALKAFFKKALPEFDEERVYVSDIKKVLKWYGILKENDLLHFEEPAEVAEAEVTEAEAVPVTANEEEATKATKTPKAKKTATDKEEKKPAKKAVAKKAMADEATAEKPKKKAVAKKKAE
jgi:hypothetical protein